MRRNIREIVDYYTHKYKTRNPFEIAECLNIQVQIGQIGTRCGCYMFLKNNRCIFLNETLTEQEMLLVMAHELAHAILHRKQDCYYIRNKTLLLNSKVEKEANFFAAELLISNETILENMYLTTEQMSRLLGYEQKIIELRLESFHEL